MNEAKTQSASDRAAQLGRSLQRLGRSSFKLEGIQLFSRSAVLTGGLIGGLAWSLAAIAIPIPVPSVSAPATPATQEIDTSISRDYEPATIYVHDPVTHKMVAHTLLVAADQPVIAAVNEIVQSYAGQPTGITSYTVRVDPVAHAAEINFTIENSRGARILESLSSTNQYSLFEAIRETLLTQPSYDIREVIFLANGRRFDL